jgi:rhamnosyltransferase
MDVPRVRVLLATYNGAAWLDEQLQSIFSQVGVYVSVLAADDGSTDSTLEILGRWKERGFALEVLPPGQERKGAAGTFFRLLAASPLDGIQAVALADQDDVWHLDRLAGALRVLRATGAAGYSSDAVAFWPDGRERKLGKAYPQRAADHLFEPAGPGCTYVLSPELVQAVQAELAASPERVTGVGYHDWWLYAFARTHGLAWHIDPDATVRYRQHDHNELGANFGFKGIRRRWGRLAGGWFRDQVLRVSGAWPGPHGEVIVRLRRLAWRDRFWLALRARSLRRRPRDQLALAAMLLLGVLR